MAIKRLVGALLMVAGVVSAQAASADLKTGIEAYHQGDYPAARRELRPLAEQGDRDAQYILGMTYFHATGELRDFAAAAGWFILAADQDHGYAQYSLGILYEGGLGVKHSQADAMSWFRRAAHNGVPEASDHIAQIGPGG